jgi:hypothetical protein
MENSKDKLARLRERNKALHQIVFVGFKTSEELNTYRSTIQDERDEYFDNQEEIWRLEWELMTPEQQARRLEVSAKIKAKTGQNNNS